MDDGARHWMGLKYQVNGLGFLALGLLHVQNLQETTVLAISGTVPVRVQC